MPKGRHLKPEFFTDKHIVSMQPLARLLYQGLWCYSADCGHLDDEPIELKMRILPADSCDVEELLADLVRSGRIERRDGVIHLPKLSDHARVDKRYETFCDACKAQREHAGNTPGRPSPKTPDTPGSRSEHDVNTRGALRDHDADGDGDGDGDGEVMVKAPRKARATQLPDDWQPNDKHREYTDSQGIDLDHEMQQFKNHAIANGKTFKNWDAAFRTWLGNAKKWNRPVPVERPRHLTPAHEIEQPPDGLTAHEYAEWARKQRERRRA